MPQIDEKMVGLIVDNAVLKSANSTLDRVDKSLVNAELRITKNVSNSFNSMTEKLMEISASLNSINDRIDKVESRVDAVEDDVKEIKTTQAVKKSYTATLIAITGTAVSVIQWVVSTFIFK